MGSGRAKIIYQCKGKSCEFCGKIIEKRMRGFTHTNIAQNPFIYYFCSKEHKVKWIFQKTREN